jgi:hypothetical protein
MVSPGQFGRRLGRWFIGAASCRGTRDTRSLPDPAVIAVIDDAIVVIEDVITAVLRPLTGESTFDEPPRCPHSDRGAHAVPRSHGDECAANSGAVAAQCE